MPKKEDSKKPASKPAKSDGEGKGGKAKKKKWTKGKVRDKLNNMVLFDKATYDKMYKEVPAYKLITPSVISERMKIRVSLAKQALDEMCGKGLIRLVSKHHSQVIYTRSTKAGDDKAADEKADDKGAAQKGEKAAGKKVGGGVSKRKADAEKQADATA